MKINGIAERIQAVALLLTATCANVGAADLPARLPPVDLHQVAELSWVQSPKLSPDGLAIAFLRQKPDGSQRVEVLRQATGAAASASAVHPIEPALNGYWINWADDERVDIRASAGGNEQIVRWNVRNDATSPLLPDDSELALTFSTSFDNFAAPVERIMAGRRVLAYDGATGIVADAPEDLTPGRCAAAGAGHLGVHGDPQQMTWELSRGADAASTDAWSLKVGPADRRQGTTLLSISARECTADFADSVGGDTLGLRRLDLLSGRYRTLFESHTDPTYASIDPRDGRVDIVGIEEPAPRAVGLTAEAASRLAGLERLVGPGFQVVDRARGDRFWLVRSGDDSCRPLWSVVEIDRGRLLWQAPEPSVAWRGKCRREALELARPGEPRISMTPTSPVTRDCRKSACDVVLQLHGGPGVRDRFAADPLADALSQAGRLVLDVNFRGSSGYGKRFNALDAGNWGSGIPADVYAAIDEVRRRGWTIDRKIAIGSSFGGYLSLLAATRDHAVDCAVAQSAPADLPAFIEFMRTLTYGGTDLLQRVGDPSIASQAAALARISPATYAADGDVPILLINGTRDAQSPVDPVVAFAKQRAAKAPVSMFVFKGEGHELSGAAARKLQFELIAAFVDRCSGGPKGSTGVAMPSAGLVEFHDGLGLLDRQ